MDEKKITKSDKLGNIRYCQNKFPDLSQKNRNNLYGYNDFLLLQNISVLLSGNPTLSLATLEELLERDKQREKDGFPKKIKIARIPAGQGKFVIIPSTEESKLFHDDFNPANDQRERTGGQGKGKEGDIIAEQPLEDQQGEGDEENAGGGEGEDHGVSADAYEYGKKLVEEFHLPNLADKGKKVAVNKYIYELSDKHKGSGLILDKKATLLQIIKTNLALGIIEDPTDIDPTKLIISPQDSIYRVLSKEQQRESQAIVFFSRDYSGSMEGTPTKVIVTQHLMLYSWLMFQYEKRVSTRFVLHDTEAKTVPDFDTYYKSNIKGGTQISTAFNLINKIVAEENLARDYNIYIFYGTDGDNDLNDNEYLIKEMKAALTFSRRIGITVARNEWDYPKQKTTAEEHLEKSNLLNNVKLLRMFALGAEDYNEKTHIKAINHLVSE